MAQSTWLQLVSERLTAFYAKARDSQLGVVMYTS